MTNFSVHFSLPPLSPADLLWQRLLYLFVWKPPHHHHIRTKQTCFLFTRHEAILHLYIYTPSHRDTYFYWPLITMAYLLHELCEYHLNHRSPAIRWSMIGTFVILVCTCTPCTCTYIHDAWICIPKKTKPLAFHNHTNTYHTTYLVISHFQPFYSNIHTGIVT